MALQQLNKLATNFGLSMQGLMTLSGTFTY